MAVASSSSYPSSVPSSCSYKYDAFISFRGEDTRRNFTSHLYEDLCRNQIETYIDEESLEKGERILELLTAIQQSRLSLIVFSKNYASSRWCLDELVQILKCKEERGQIVLPIFYHVDPSDIRHQTGSYGDAFVEHQQRFKYDMNKVQEWRKALKEAVDLSGFHLQDHDSEANFVKRIVEEVLKRLYNFPSRNADDDFQGLVGIRKRLQKIESSLSVGSLVVRIIGIWGMGGIGKTTLAQALYKRLSSQFESCFFTNVKDDVSKHGLDSLMEKMFCKLLKRGSVDMDSYFKDEQLRHRKVLVVLDNVNEPEQLECLFGDFYQQKMDRFGVGSRIIITSRDKRLLMSRADEIHEVDALDSNEARELFYMKAFKRDSAISTTCKDLAERVLDYAKGHPLTLKVLGSHLQSRSIKEWESEMSKLEKGPDETVQKVLKMSFDDLSRIEKSIFLDIACFFKGKDRNFIEGILDKESHLGIIVLNEKSLITIDEREIIRMHDLIQEMGWEIVREESRNEHAKRSRLWNAQDVLPVLENNEGTKHIEGLFLDMSKIDKDLCLKPAVFKAMSNLRLLKIYYPYHKNEKKFKVYLHQGLRYLPHSLRYLNWSNYPLKTLPTKFRPESLVELKMPHSQLKQLWDGVQPLGNLKHIDFKFSKQLVKIPDLSHASRLVSVDLKGCESLVEIPPLNFQNFDERALAYLETSFCTNLKILPEICGNVRELRLGWSGIKELPSSIRSLEHVILLDVTRCGNLENLPELPRNIETLRLAQTSIREIPAASIDCLHRVREIRMYDCKRLESLPSNICKLKALRELHLEGCSNLKHFPQILEPMANLESLYLRGAGIREFPSPIENIMGLRVLNMHGCRDLKTIPECHSKLSCLGLHSLQHLDLGYCRISKVPYWIGDLSSLKRINLEGNMFTSIPSSIKKLSKLTYLNISHCQNLLSVPKLPLSVQELRAIGCTSMEMVFTSSLWSIRALENSWDNCLRADCEFLFCKCLKLDQNSVAMDFLCKIIGIGVIHQLNDKQKKLRYGSIKACYLGNEIPKWMRHQSEGSSKTTIKLPPNWHSSNFFGFVLCAVVSSEELYWCKNLDHDFVDIHCLLYEKTKYVERIKGVFSWNLNKRALRPEDEQEEEEMLRSDHVFMLWHCLPLYECNDHVDAVEMSFEFSCKDEERGYFKCQVKRWGVHMLYIEEEVINEFDMSIQRYVEYMVEAEERGISILQCMNNSEECDQSPRLGDSIRGGPAFGGGLYPRSGDMTSPVNLGIHDGRPECPIRAVSSTSSLQQSFSQSMPQLVPISQQIFPLQMPIQSPQQLPPFLQLHPQTLASYSQSHPPLSSLQQLGQLHYSSGQPSIGQPLPSQQLACSNRQLPISQPQVQHSLSSATSLQSPLYINLQRQGFSQLQQQLGLMQPSSSQDTKQQQQQAITSLPATIASADVHSSSTSVAPAVSVKCSWREHFSPDGYKYYYNNVTGEGKREKPEELILYEQQQQQQQKAIVLQNQSQSLHQRPTAQQVSQTPQSQFQTQFQMQAQQQFQQAPLCSMGYTQLQGVTSSWQQAVQQWMWKNNQADATDQVNNLTRSEIAPTFYDFFSMEVPLDDDKNSAGPQWDSTATHVEGLCLSLSLALSPCGDQTNNILIADDLDTIINESELSNT